jgi:hypothetical protein
MLVPYSENYNQESIAGCLEKQVYDAPEWYMNDYATLEKKKDKYYVSLSVPARANGYSRYTRKWRLTFKEKGICAREKFTFFSVVAYFGIFVTGFCSVAMLFSGDIFLTLMSLFIFALFVGLFFIRTKKNIKNFLEKKMSN